MRFAHKNTVPILMYHSISAQASARFRQFTVSAALFAEQMNYLFSHGFTTLTVTDYTHLNQQGCLPEKPVVITFDDGFADFYSAALPTLKRYGFVATLYVATAFVDGTSRWLQREGEAARPILTWNQLGELANHGIECGAHTHTHPQLDTLSALKAREEIVRSKKILEDHLGHEIQSFAYPYGYYTVHTRQLVREAGFTSACAVKHALSSASDNPFSLARLMVGAETHLQAFATLVDSDHTQPRVVVKQSFLSTRTLAWQLARRSSAFAKHTLHGGR